MAEGADNLKTNKDWSLVGSAAGGFVTTLSLLCLARATPNLPAPFRLCHSAQIPALRGYLTPSPSDMHECSYFLRCAGSP